MGPMRDLVTRRVVIAIHSDSFDPESLQRNQYLFTQFPRTKQHDPGGIR